MPQTIRGAGRLGGQSKLIDKACEPGCAKRPVLLHVWQFVAEHLDNLALGVDLRL
ncbi:hypothetical protein [Bradyrhizobium japonicum]|uniref:hypothetical protein n=1 Tax=Bradyrhizobium japonicum TaxID=375 RepID=UPI00200FF9B9|nr:hypothetical protein [Bradyrhizobium japonicum]UQD97208.1 hypothetical protein JEY30_37870 [Bradyrhizobium japonicum]